MNNPVMLTDPDGNLPFFVVFAVHIGVRMAIRYAARKGAQKVVKSIVRKAVNKVKTIKNSRKTCNCFTEDTKVLTEDGEKAIKDIQIGDLVLSKDDVTGAVAYKEVVGLFQKEADEIYYIYVGGEIIETTAEHPFWVLDVG